MGRIEYYDNPAAPEPDSLVVAAAAVVTGAAGAILLQRRADSSLWALPGGGMDLSESIAETAVREVREETGLDIELTGIVGIYTDPRHIIAYTNGEVRRQFNICFAARWVGGELCGSDESTAVRFVSHAELDDLPMHHTQRLRLRHHLEQREYPYVG